MEHELQVDYCIKAIKPLGNKEVTVKGFIAVEIEDIPCSGRLYSQEQGVVHHQSVLQAPSL